MFFTLWMLLYFSFTNLSFHWFIESLIYRKCQGQDTISLYWILRNGSLSWSCPLPLPNLSDLTSIPDLIIHWLACHLYLRMLAFSFLVGETFVEIESCVKWMWWERNMVGFCLYFAHHRFLLFAIRYPFGELTGLFLVMYTDGERGTWNVILFRREVCCGRALKGPSRGLQHPPAASDPLLTRTVHKAFLGPSPLLFTSISQV